jgi:isoaspartyl peptidase/L-asparaginase-like protein (Ntn-hydrolase superfamily)
MKNYSIVRLGNEYVVQAGETSVLKVSSRRQAAKLVTDAAELLEQVPAPSVGEDASLACEGEVAPDSARVIPDPAEVP